MQATTNEHGEKVTVIGTVRGCGQRIEVRVEEYTTGGRRLFALKAGLAGCGDARRFSTQVKRAKSIFADPSNAAEWYC